MGSLSHNHAGRRRGSALPPSTPRAPSALGPPDPGRRRGSAPPLPPHPPEPHVPSPPGPCRPACRTPPRGRPPRLFFRFGARADPEQALGGRKDDLDRPAPAAPAGRLPRHHAGRARGSAGRSGRPPRDAAARGSGSGGTGRPGRPPAGRSRRRAGATAPPKRRYSSGRSAPAGSADPGPSRRLARAVRTLVAGNLAKGYAAAGGMPVSAQHGRRESG